MKFYCKSLASVVYFNAIVCCMRKLIGCSIVMEGGSVLVENCCLTQRMRLPFETGRSCLAIHEGMSECVWMCE